MAYEISELKPRNLGGIIEEVFRVYSKNLLPFLAIVAIVEVPLVIIVAFLGETPSFLSAVLFTVISFLVSIAMYGALVYALSYHYLGNRVDIVRSYQFIWQRLGVLIGATLLVFMAILVLAIIIVGIPLAIYLGVTWAFVCQVVVLEGVGIRDALARSSARVKNSWWRVFGILIVLGLVSAALGIIPSTILGLSDAMGISATAANAITSLVAMVIYPIAIIGSTLLYYDLRLRKESYNVGVMAQELGARRGDISR